MICGLTGEPHRLFWMRSAWWCAECRQKVESCCEGGGCPSVVEVLGAAQVKPAPGERLEQALPGAGSA
jgi:hypothetical protein